MDSVVLMGPFQLETFYGSLSLRDHLVPISACNGANLKDISNLPEVEDFTASLVCVARFGHLHRDFLVL